jgi:DNA-binding CsgD family transcriptional regulator
MYAKKAVKRKSAGANRDTTQERLTEVMSKFATLREDGRALIDRIHSSLTEMRELRQQIREQRTGTSTDHDAEIPSRGAYLRKRFRLTAREAEVALLLAQGRSNVAIAKTLGISTHTARHHTQRVLGKLRVHSRAEAGAKLRS